MKRLISKGFMGVIDFQMHILGLSRSVVSLPPIMSLTSLEIKQKFLSFFADKNHKIVSSAPIVVKGDPTLMFTNAGMNQFKDYFLGNAVADIKRVANSQKCLRVSGKHNDLDEVGHDHYHHTMFEMLGNWSFGDYFKKEAINWAWELLTEVYKLPVDRLYVTVFEGDADAGIHFDQEAFDLWSELIDPKRIVKGNKKDNFWEMGETGPCGPCTEIHYDMRSDADRANVDGATLVNMDHPEVIEIWNNVFMEFNRKADGSLVKLPAQHVDTGMGFERLVRVIQKKSSNYDTDIFQFTIQKTASLCGKSYGLNEEQDIAFRVIADHIRAVAMCIADGQLPANNGAGYVVRRILRRAVRYGYSYLDFQTPFMFELIPGLAAYFETSFPELKDQQEFIAKVIREEELSFFRTLSTGIAKLNTYFESNPTAISGSMAFELYDTYGFPIDLTEVIAREKQIQIDLEGFENALLEQKNRSKADAKKETGDWIYIIENADETFCGYDLNSIETQITRYRTIVQKGESLVQIVLLDSPFYAESGGQVGDTGELNGSDGEKIEIIDTQKENKLHICLAKNIPQNPNQTFSANVNTTRRALISANHSATHLMHSALKEVLGEHVAQKGSLVNDEQLRFDFSHFSKMSEKELQLVENRVNEKIRENIKPTEHRNVPIQQAKDMGATALFGEKYGDFVRVIKFDRSFSIELCGGTHVKETAQIGMFRLLSEGSVSAGVRRIEAITNTQAWNYMNGQLEELKAIGEVLNNPKNNLEAIQKMMAELDGLKKELSAFQLLQLMAKKDQLLQNMHFVGDISFVFSTLELPNADAAKQLCFQIKQEVEKVVCVLAYTAENKPGLAIYIDESLVQEKGWNAAVMIRECGKLIQGGGGGQPFFATAGGKDSSGLSAALDKAKSLFLN